MRVLFGPLPATTAAPLAEARAGGEWLFFGPDPGLDLRLAGEASWEEVEARLPAGWRPEALLLNLPYAQLAPGLWRVPLPKVALAPEARHQWRTYRQLLPKCDLVLADRASAPAFTALGCPVLEVGAFPFWPPPEPPTEAVERDLDLLFIGNLHPAVQRRRLPWLTRLARLGDRWRVHLASGVAPAEHARLLRRAKAVVDLSAPGHASRRLLEAAAAGALVLAPRHCDGHLPGFRDGAEWLLFGPDDFEIRVEEALGDEERRRAIAAAGQAAAAPFAFPAWRRRLEADLRGMALPAAGIVSEEEATWLSGWQALSAPTPAAPELLTAVERHAAGRPAWRNLAALLLGRLDRAPQPAPAALRRLLDHLRAAATAAPHAALLQTNLAVALHLAGEVAAAAQQARHALRLLELPEADFDVADWASFPARFDPLRCALEELAWNDGSPGTPAREPVAALLRWRLHALLGELTGDAVHAYEAARAQPELPAAQAALGHKLLGAGQAVAALEPLRRAVALHPLDQVAVQALHQALGLVGATAEQRGLEAARRLLRQAAPRLVPAEPWFAPAPPERIEAGPLGLVSVIIPCCNGLTDTQACVASLLAHTSPAAFELIVVDNGSTDGTAAFAQELQADLGVGRVRLSRHERRLGFPEACNQGAALAQGEFLLFLNNDTLVAAGWLEGLLRPLADAQVGLVGPTSNHVPPPQQVEAGYADAAGLAAFAAARRRAHAGRVEAIPRVSGFCFVLRRRLFEELGGFDVRFGLGFFDDDDLCRRARARGLKLLLAHEVFVHHHGGRTFTGLGLDRDALLEANKAKFVEKWGPDALAGYRLVALPAAGPPAQPARRRVSLTMIVKDEEANLPDCLRSIRDLVDEAIVADTGSRDRTRAIAQSFGCTVVSFPWIDHFAAARNAALAPATGDWILWTDADDRYDEENRAKLRRLFAELPAPRDAYAVKIRSALDGQGRAVRLLDQVRLFPRHPQVRWEYRIHEQILPAVRRRGGEVRWTDLVVDHVGYVDPEVRGGKLRRNIRLLRLDEAERPFDSFTLFNLGWTLLDLGETEEAILRLRRSLEHATPDSSILRKIYGLLTQAHRQGRQWRPALELARQGRSRCPDDLELPFEEALILRDLGDLAGAERCLLQLLAIPERQYFASVDPELKPVRSRVLLAELARRQGRLGEAVRHAREGLAAQPKHVPLWLEWAEAALAARHWPDLERVAVGLAKEAGQPLEGEILLARGERALGDFPAARRRLERLLAQLPDALGPRLLLGHVLAQAGQRPEAAAAFQQVLNRAPGHPEARKALRELDAPAATSELPNAAPAA